MADWLPAFSNIRYMENLHKVAVQSAIAVGDELVLIDGHPMRRKESGVIPNQALVKIP